MRNDHFDPFQDRLSRDIRNDLSAALIRVISQQNLQPALEAADRYLRRDCAPFYREYIAARLAGYRKFLDRIRGGTGDAFRQALMLWDQKLFFEVHEVLEQKWRSAGGEEKSVLQGMIRAAGVYIKLEGGYRESARKTAGKALSILKEHREFLARYFEPEELYSHLQDLSLPPPQLLDISTQQR